MQVWVTAAISIAFMQKTVSQQRAAGGGGSKATASAARYEQTAFTSKGLNKGVRTQRNQMEPEKKENR